MNEYITYEEIYRLYQQTRIHKKKGQGAKKFEVNELYNLKTLQNDINNRTYKLRPARCFIVEEPTLREVFCCDFRDRIVQRFVYNEINPYIEKKLIFDAANCRKGKGTDFAIKRVERFVRSSSKNYKEPTYFLKVDLSGFFMSIDRKRTLSIVNKIIENDYEGKYKETLKYLVNIIIPADLTNDVTFNSKKELWERLPARKTLFGNPNGLPIGNLCSQLFANYYLNDLDHIIKSRERYYSRYVDDLIIINQDKNHLKNTLEIIEKYLPNIGMKISKNKTYIKNVKYGIPYLGVKIFPHFTVLGKSRINRIYSKKFRDVEHAYMSIASRKGMIQRYHGRRMFKRYFYKLDLPFGLDSNLKVIRKDKRGNHEKEKKKSKK